MLNISNNINEIRYVDAYNFGVIWHFIPNQSKNTFQQQGNQENMTFASDNCHVELILQKSFMQMFCEQWLGTPPFRLFIFNTRGCIARSCSYPCLLICYKSSNQPNLARVGNVEENIKGRYAPGDQRFIYSGDPFPSDFVKFWDSLLIISILLASLRPISNISVSLSQYLGHTIQWFLMIYDALLWSMIAYCIILRCPFFCIALTSC